jgi:hypothetical protein
VTIVDSTLAVAADLSVDARLFVLDDGVTAVRRAAFNDDKVVMVARVVIVGGR